MTNALYKKLRKLIKKKKFKTLCMTRYTLVHKTFIIQHVTLPPLYIIISSSKIIEFITPLKKLRIRE